VESSLRPRFAALMQVLGASQASTEAWSAEFVTRYTEPQRHYHTLAHIAAMLECLDTRRAEIADAIAVELAVVFHDWIYQPQGTANEVESVVEFVKFAEELKIEEGLKAKVVRMIEATVVHLVEDKVPNEEVGDLKLFLDFDLEVLGREWTEYDAYSRKIRMEYDCFNDLEYNAGRTKVLRKFLERDRLYFSDVFYHEREQVARANMEKEIQILEAGKTSA
jgi:predicted metal-dependent HD superfamily phosphohydrolase